MYKFHNSFFVIFVILVILINSARILKEKDSGTPTDQKGFGPTDRNKHLFTCVLMMHVPCVMRSFVSLSMRWTRANYEQLALKERTNSDPPLGWVKK